MPAISHAQALGHEVVTCDFRPENPGHALAHRYFNVSTTDQEAVLALAGSLSIDGILAFASDPAAPTAAYVASRLGLPGASPEAVRVLTNKIAFRRHQAKHGFNAPSHHAAHRIDEALQVAATIGYPLMIKPCDSSGSKGVRCIASPQEVPEAFDFAMQYSRSKTAILERRIARCGHQIAGDGLVVNGRVVFGCFGNEHFDPLCSSLAPVGESFPGALEGELREDLFEELGRLFASLGVQNLVFNLDAIVDESARIVLIEIGPRAGGNCLPQVIKDHTGVDLTDIAIRMALGEEIVPSMYAGNASGFHASWMIHAQQDGRLVEYRVAAELRPYIRAIEFMVAPGASVKRFSSSADTLGYARFAFPTASVMTSLFSDMGALLAVQVE